MVMVSIRFTKCARCTLSLSKQPDNRVTCKREHTTKDYCDTCFSILFEPDPNGTCTNRRLE